MDTIGAFVSKGFVVTTQLWTPHGPAVARSPLFAASLQLRFFEQCLGLGAKRTTLSSAGL